MANDERIDQVVVEAILAGRLKPGTRLAEHRLGEIFGVSRTRVREALMKLEARGMVHVSARRGWFVATPSAAEAHAAYEARKVIETGLLLSMRAPAAGHIEALRGHVAAEAGHVDAGDVAARSCALGDFHIRLVEATGNPILIDILRDLTARTTLVSMLYQSNEDAAASHADHCAILDAIEAGDFAGAARLMTAHIDDVEKGLDLDVRRASDDDLRFLLRVDPGTPSAPSNT